MAAHVAARRAPSTGASLDLAKGEFVTLLGDSGCGKTTLLRIITGFVRPDSGQVTRGGQDVTEMAPARRRMGFVFQSYALFPTEDGRGQYRLCARHHRRAAPSANSASAKPWRSHGRDGAPAGALSARALRRPAAAGRAGHRARLRSRGAAARRADVGLGCPYPRQAAQRAAAPSSTGSASPLSMSTHDQEEALALSDRVAVMRNGQRSSRSAWATEIYHRPCSAFVAQFVGTLQPRHLASR